MNEIQASRLVHDRYQLRFSQLLHKINRSIVGITACSVSKACGACRTSQGEMRGPLKEQIQNAINRALKESLASNNQAAYINVGGRRRNRKKKKNKKNNGVVGSAWSTLHFHVNEPPARCRIDIPPKAKGESPQVTKAKKTCKEIKARLSPPRSCVKDVLEADDRPLIGNEAAGDENEASEDEREAAEVDQENINPDNMPLSSLFKTTKGKKNKSKKGKGKDATETNVANDATSPKEAQAEEQTPTAASPQASDVSGTSPSDDVKKTEEEKMADKVEGLQEKEKEKKEENDVGSEQNHANSSDAKTDVTSSPQDSAAVLYTTESRDVTLAAGEGPQLSPSEGGKMEEEGGAVDMQPAKADGSLPPETPGREKQSLLHDHNPEGMVCCTIL